LLVEMMSHLASFHAVHVPYGGLTPALMDVLGERVDFMFHDPASTLPFIRSGRLKALAVTGDSRLAELPETPTIAETFPGFRGETWYALTAPPKTPDDTVERIFEAVAKALKGQKIAAVVGEASLRVVGSAPAQAETFIKRERERWRAAIEQAGLRRER
jgi:tripartite-type tricarboxylate transporter receptor subunit TctC